MPQAVALIVPCFNEAARLAPDEFLGFVRARPELSLLFVDDGSTDATPSVLEALRRDCPDRIVVRRLGANGGKGEAVRAGLRAALAGGAGVVGYWDADLSTPAEEMARLVDEIERTGAQVVLASRVRLLGWDIQRKAHRHYLGRVFATLASLALRLPVYDTQCGAKLFRASPTLEAALARPFRSRWIFDVELLGRLVDPADPVPAYAAGSVRELPLRAWRDVGGSKLGATSMLRAGAQICGLLVRSWWRALVRARPLAPAPPALPAATEAVVEDVDGDGRHAAGTRR